MPFAIRIQRLARLAGRWYDFVSNPWRRAHMKRVGFQLVPIVSGGASPFTVDATLGGSYGLEFSSQRRVGVLGDGSILTADATSATVTTLNRLTGVAGLGTPTVTAVTTVTYGGGATTALVADLLVVNGTTFDDIWLCICSDGGAGATVEVQHGTFTYATQAFAWDTKTTAVTASLAASQVCTIAWAPGINSGAGNLIVAYRDGSSPWRVNMVWTATKNGTSGWSTVVNIGTTTSTGSHAFPILRYAPNLLGGVSGGTILIYTVDTVSTHSDSFRCRVLPDSATSAAIASWQAEVSNAGTISAQNVNTAIMDATIDWKSGVVQFVYNSSAAGTGGAIGTSILPITVNSGGTATFGTRTTIDTTSTVDINVYADALGNLTVAMASGAVASNSVINYRQASSPWTSWGASTATVWATAANGANRPHMPKQPLCLTFVPLFVQVGKTSFSSQFDNTVEAAATLAAETAPPANASITSLIANLYTIFINSVSSFVGNLTTSSSGTPLGGNISSSSGSTGVLTEAVALIGKEDAISSLTGTFSGSIALAGTITSSSTASATFFTYPVGLVVSTQTQNGISGGPPGNGTTETDVTWTDSSGNGWRVGSIPAYGGAVIAPWYEMDAGTPTITQLSLSTTQADGFVHMEAVVGASFLGSEQFTYTRTELAFGSYERRYYDSGTSAADANGVTWRVRQAIYPGDPGFIFTRIDMGNPSGSAITLNGASDAADYDPIAGLTQVLQGGVNAWQPANGGYGTVGGANTTPWPSTYTAGDPDYYYIIPQSGSGINDGQVGVRKTLLSTISGASGIQFAYQQNANRLKMNVKVTSTASIPATTTYSFFFLSALRRNLAGSTEAPSIAADYLNPDAGSIVKQGTAGSPFWSDDEGCYVVAASNNGVLLTHTFPTNVTRRWLPAYKVTNWTDTSGNVPVSLGGVPLVKDTDYLAAVDTTNQIAYVKLMFQLVPSGAGAGQKNNAQIEIGTALVGSFGATSSLTGNATFTLAVAANSASISAATGTLSLAVAVASTSAAISVETGTLAEAVALAAPSTSVTAESGVLSEALALAGTNVSVTTAGGNLTTSAQFVLQGTIASTSQTSGLLSEAASLQASYATVTVSAGNLTTGAQFVLQSSVGSSSQVVGTLALSLALQAPVVDVSVTNGNLQVLSGQQIAGTFGGVSSVNGSLSLAASLSSQPSSQTQLAATLALAVAIAGAHGSVSTLSSTLQILTGTQISGAATSVSMQTGILLLASSLVANPAAVSAVGATMTVQMALRGTVSAVTVATCANVLAGPVYIIVEAQAVSGFVLAEAVDGSFEAYAVDGSMKAGV